MKKLSFKNKPLVLLLNLMLTILFSFAGVIVKYTSLSLKENSFFSVQVFMLLFLYVVILGIYAIFWQKVLQRIPLSIAYSIRTTSIIWSIIFAYIFFAETITLMNITGVIIIIIGVYLVILNV